ncbi:MAG: DUF177 domain-containing protein [Actinobacteria bacterium]|nr:DUF177 domain-containing protein [Actinomycetota bacterium]
MAKNGLVVVVADLLQRPGARRRVQQSGSMDGLRVVGSAVPDRSDVSVDVTLEWVTDGILATGVATGPFEAECRRCLGRVTSRAEARFQELYEPRPRDGETYPLQGDRIDLAPLAREALLLELPLAPLCREGCLGLCGSCGADLNAGACTCPSAGADSRWAALDVLRTDPEPN